MRTSFFFFPFKVFEGGGEEEDEEEEGIIMTPSDAEAVAVEEEATAYDNDDGAEFNDEVLAV